MGSSTITGRDGKQAKKSLFASRKGTGFLLFIGIYVPFGDVNRQKNVFSRPEKGRDFLYYSEFTSLLGT